MFRHIPSLLCNSQHLNTNQPTTWSHKSLQATLFLTDKTERKTRGRRRRRPDQRVRGRPPTRDAIHRDRAGKEGAHGRHTSDEGGARDDDAAAQRVSPDVPPDSLGEAGANGVELADPVVLLAAAGGDVRRKEELAGGAAKDGRRGQQREKRGRVRRRHRRDAAEMEHQHARQHEAQRERHHGRVHGRRQRAREQLKRHRHEVPVVELRAGAAGAAGEAQTRERPREGKRGGRRGGVDERACEGRRRPHAVEARNEPKGRRVRDKRDEPDVDAVEVGGPRERHLGGAPGRQERQLRGALGRGAQPAELVARRRRERDAARDEQRQRQRLGCGESGGRREPGEERSARIAGAARRLLDLRAAGPSLATLLDGGGVLVLGGLGGAALAGGRVLFLFGGALRGGARGLARLDRGRSGGCRVGRSRAGFALDGFSRHLDVEAKLLISAWQKRCLPRVMRRFWVLMEGVARWCGAFCSALLLTRSFSVGGASQLLKTVLCRVCILESGNWWVNPALGQQKRNCLQITY